MSLAALLIIICAIGLMWTGTMPVEERVVAVRMFLFFGSALIAFITPYLLYPDPYAMLLQLGNISSDHLFRHLARRSGVIWAGSLLFLLVICFGDMMTLGQHLGTKTMYFLTGSVFISSLFIYSVCRYTRSGLRSQFWQESDRGRELRNKMGEYFKYPIDPGSVPSFVNTAVVGIFGMLGVSIGAALYGQFGQMYESLPAAGLLIIAAVAVSKLRENLVQNYYSTHSFFSEFFGDTVVEMQEGSRIQVHQLWWVPVRIKSYTWALLVQLDRAFPAGRILAVGHLLIWLLSYRDPGDQVMIPAWLLFALFHHVVIVISLSDRFAPGWFSKWMGSATVWVLTRMWMQFRWILILVVSMLFNSLIFGHVSYAAQGTILLFYIVSAGLISLTAHVYQNVLS